MHHIHRMQALHIHRMRNIHRMQALHIHRMHRMPHIHRMQALLSRHIHRMATRLGGSEYSFYPRSLVLPDQIDEFCGILKRNKAKVTLKCMYAVGMLWVC